MSEQPVRFYSKLLDPGKAAATAQPEETDRPAPSTCVEAEPFALRVLDDSMQPEFRRGCIIVIDPTGRARHGSYVLARTGSCVSGPSVDASLPAADGYLFRQLQRTPDGHWILQPLNEHYRTVSTANDLHQVVGVIVQRAGTRRSYHKRYA